MTKNELLKKESVLIELSKNGDEKAFQELILNILPACKNIFERNFNLNINDINDISQNALLLAWKNIKNYKYGLFYNWFFEIMKNETLLFLRRRNRTENMEIQNVVFDEDFEHDKNVSHEHHINELDYLLTDTARSFLEKKEQINQFKILIQNTLSKLKQKHREIIQLVLIEEKSYKQVSEILNVPIGTVCNRLSVAKKNAKKIIEKSNFELV